MAGTPPQLPPESLPLSLHLGLHRARPPGRPPDLRQDLPPALSLQTAPKAQRANHLPAKPRNKKPLN